ncbi:MAG: phosphoribosylanthranilate isomerase [Paludibacteraceae bacterium]|nr:phosphoribosylanthranilate isomerase [Paludibacteraceae bacterium]
MLVKVCGMSSPEKIEKYPELSADFMGLIFYPKSKRFVESGLYGTEDEILKALAVVRDAGIKIVGVFVDEPVSTLQFYANKYSLDYIQLHGAENPELARKLKSLGHKVIKAIPVSGLEDIMNISNDWDGVADYLLFDYKCAEKGGSGKKFDWSVLSEYKGETPFILSGGLGPDDAQDILNLSHDKFVGVDLNSKFEIAPGLKDLDLLTKFINELRA